MNMMLSGQMRNCPRSALDACDEGEARAREARVLRTCPFVWPSARRLWRASDD